MFHKLHLQMSDYVQHLGCSSSRRIRHDKAHIDICLSPALRGFFRQKQGDADEKSVIYLAKLCFIVYPCQTARHKAAECISPF
ncbi:hypothetical protein, partial [Escherichia coli]|uniref:hypothetical protein n=1 Tax=Escherichia coli TaxID=562 RepID=UPI00049409EB